VEFKRDAFPKVLLKSLGVLLSKFLSGVTNAGEKFKEILFWCGNLYNGWCFLRFPSSNPRS
jgi:hypothetical protein